MCSDLSLINKSPMLSLINYVISFISMKSWRFRISNECHLLVLCALFVYIQHIRSTWSRSQTLHYIALRCIGLSCYPIQVYFTLHKLKVIVIVYIISLLKFCHWHIGCPFKLLPLVLNDLQFLSFLGGWHLKLNVKWSCS